MRRILNVRSGWHFVLRKNCRKWICNRSCLQIFRLKIRTKGERTRLQTNSLSVHVQILSNKSQKDSSFTPKGTRKNPQFSYRWKAIFPERLWLTIPKDYFGRVHRQAATRPLGVAVEIQWKQLANFARVWEEEKEEEEEFVPTVYSNPFALETFGQHYIEQRFTW